MVSYFRNVHSKYSTADCLLLGSRISSLFTDLRSPSTVLGSLGCDSRGFVTASLGVGGFLFVFFLVPGASRDNELNRA